MLKAVVYLSNTGHTEQYARMLAERLALPAYSLDNAQKELPAGTAVAYLGWVCAGEIKGCEKALKLFDVKAICAVGMSIADENTERAFRERHHIDGKALLYLQGGFNMKKLRGPYLLMMKLMATSLNKQLEKKKERTAADEDMLSLLKNGGSRVCAENLDPVIACLSAGDAAQ